MWGPPRPGIEPTSHALAGRFLTTRPPEKPWILSLNVHIFYLTLYIYFRIISSVFFFSPISLIHYFSSVQSLSCVWLFATPWITARQASLSITNSRSSLRLTSIESVIIFLTYLLGLTCQYCIQLTLEKSGYEMCGFSYMWIFFNKYVL